MHATVPPTTTPTPGATPGRRARRATGLAAAAVLAATVLVAAPATSATAAEGAAPSARAATPDDLPVRLGTRWLRGRLVEGQLVNQEFDFVDTGLSIDAGLAFADVEAGDALRQVADAVLTDDVLASYTSFTQDDGTLAEFAGALGKAVVLADVANVDPATVGGDLVARLEQRVTAGGASAGRVVDAGSSDFANTFSQAYATAGLLAVASERSGDALAYLLDQQCAGTGFRGTLAARDAADPSCTDPAAATTDATALVLRLLAPYADRPAVAAALASGTTWLTDQQSADGAFGGGPSTEGDNANSTGLAGWALGTLADFDVLPEALDDAAQDAAAEAALWVRRLQAADPAACRTGLTGRTGAIAYDPATRDALRDGTLAFGDRVDQTVRAATQALPALRHLPPSAPADLRLEGPTSFVRAGSAVSLTLTGVADGQPACLAGTLVTGDGGALDGTVRAPGRTADRTLVATVVGGDGLVEARTTLRSLGEADLPVALDRDAVRRGGDLVVRVRGLQPGEPVELRLGGDVVASGTASGRGRFVRTVEVDAPRGRTRVVATGAFADLRRGAATVRVR